MLILAKAGCFVPAAKAQIGICDRIFTRIGASDSLNEGKSTFLVEMIEAAIILNNATPRSLILLDEIGRGTSTYDGLSIAWAVVEFLLPMNITAYHLAKETKVSQTRISQIIRDQRGITVDTALRLAKFFGNSHEFWINLQNHYDLEESKQAIGKQLKQIKHLSFNISSS